MSASEKLRALDGKFEGLRVGDTPPPVLELTFWPQIVAVVEAAEWISESGVLSFDRYEALCDSLGALDQAIGGVGVVRDSKLTDLFSWNSRDGVTYDAGRDKDVTAES